MKNSSTPFKSEGIADTADHAPAKLHGPRKSTISLLRQFARAYTCAATMPVAIGCFVAN